jgi:hypothetical protein
MFLITDLASLVLLSAILYQLVAIRRELHPKTPTQIHFKEITMLDATAGNTLVYTGTLSPAGSAFSAGTTFAVTSSDPLVAPTVDATGLVVTIPLPDGFVDDPANPLTITYTASGITPVPADSPTSLTSTITPTVPVPPTPTPTAISFAQTT